VRPCCLLAAILSLSAVACDSRVRFMRTEQADFLRVRGEYAIIFIHQEFAQRAFGSDWSTQSLFYRPAFGVDQDGRKANITYGSLRPIAKGEVLLTCSGDDWAPQMFDVYSLEKDVFVLLEVDLQRGKIEAKPPHKPRWDTRPTVRENGLLYLPSL
jgi:hypothetical protein